MSIWRHGFVLNTSVLVMIMIPSRLLVRLVCSIGLFWRVYCARNYFRRLSLFSSLVSWT